MTDPDPTRSFETQLEISAPRDAVWEAIATDAGLRRWFAPVATIDARIGGEVVWEWAEHHRWPQRIEILEPGVRLRTRGDSQVDDGQGGKKPLWIDFLLEGEGGTTTLRLVQSGFGPEAGFDEEYDGISRGWPVELRSLRLYLEKHRNQDRHVAWSTVDLDMSPADAWRALTSEDGLAIGANTGSMEEGDAFRFQTPDGDLFEGRVLHGGANELVGEVTSFGDAFLRISVEVWGGQTHVWCWLATYGQDPDAVAALQDRWDARLRRLFARSGESA